MQVSAAAASGTSKRRVMVVADPGRESAGALQWALSHAVLERDELLLLHLEPPNSRRGTFSSFRRRPTLPSSGPNAGAGAGAANGANPADGGGDYEFLEVMRTTCEAAQPKVKVQVERVEIEGKDKASTILSQSIAMSIDLLVIGQPRRSTFLGGKLGGGMSGRGMDTAEYLIENSKCLCVGVQKKGQNAGYLLNTKTHKNFWLLA